MKLTKQILKKLIRETIRENRMTLVEAQINANFSEVMDVLRGKTNVRTVGIMSGQNPMATATNPQKNRLLDERLRAMLDEMGLDYKVVGGVFDEIEENSVIIYNPTMQQMVDLNVEFNQWGYVYGTKINNKMEFTMQKMHGRSIDKSVDPELAAVEKRHHEAGDLGSFMPSDSNYASEIHTDSSNPTGAGRDDNYTMIDGQKVVIPLYKKYGDPPASQLTGLDKYYHNLPRKAKRKKN